jgi:ankyrin repeat protein
VLAPAESLVHGQLVDAAREGQYQARLNYLLNHGADVDAKNDQGLTALHYATFRGDHENVKLLLDRGANVNVETYDFGAPIFLAALKRHTKVVEVLLQHKADLSMSFDGLATALHCACFGGDVAIFESILRHGQDGDLVRVQVVHLETLAFMADANLASYHDVPRRKRIRISTPSIRCSPLLLAAKRCQFDMIQLCRLNFYDAYCSPGTWETVVTWESTRYASKNSTFSAWSDLGFALPTDAAVPMNPTLLMWGAASLNLPLIEHLLEAGEKTDTQDTVGRTAIHYAALPLEHATFEDVSKCFQRLLQGSSMNLQIAETLLRLTVSAEHPALDPRTSHKWGSNIHSRCIASILDNSKSTHEKQRASCEALQSIASYDMVSEDSIALLCKNSTVPDGDASQLARVYECLTTALHRALYQSASYDVILILLKHGADPNHCSEYQSLPLTTAILEELTKDVISALLDYGADPNKIDATAGVPANTPFEMAAKAGVRANTPYKLAAFTERQDVTKLLKRVSSEQAKAIWKANRRLGSAHSVEGLSTMAGTDAPHAPNECGDATRTAKATPRRKRRSWFAGVSAFPLPRFLKDSRLN